MTDYKAPLDDMRFVLEAIVDMPRIEALPGQDGIGGMVGPVLDQAARFASERLAPLNRTGDIHGCRLQDDIVHTAPGFREAYLAYREAGWNAVPFQPEHGGQGLPWVLAFAVQEMWQSANMAFGLCPLLNQGAVEALTHHGSAQQKAMYLGKLISGEWTGTMNLTEPQAGSDLAALRMRAVREGDRFRLFGQKIYITYGEHDLTANIVHIVLARIEGAPDGVKGISLFIAPKYLPNEDGTPGVRNDLRCVSLEHKLGIHASPTAVMAYGDADGAIGTLVGEENRGIEYMFTMMNNARLSVGLQGVAIAERAYQQARDYAASRVQGRTMLPGGHTIDFHPDVRRMLLHMRALTEAGRALTYLAACQLDIAQRSEDETERHLSQARVDLLTPIVKGWCTDLGNEVASLGVQVHGGMGYIEDTGAAQHFRDARIAPIYEGANGIQANDLVFRKTLRDKGVAAKAFIGEIEAVASAAIETGADDLSIIGQALQAGAAALLSVVDWIVMEGEIDPARIAAGAYAYLRLFGLTAGGFMMARAALAECDDPAFIAAKRMTARYYADVLLPETGALAIVAQRIGNSVSGNIPA